LRLGLNSIYATGRDNNIDENIYPVVNFLNESRENIYRSLYSTVCLMASYRYKQFTFEAGPGVYFLYNGNTYHIERTNGGSGGTYVDDIKTRLRSEKFFNGLIQVDWRISGHFQVGAGVGIGGDLSANAGAVYFL
jgi:hypothetical protein